MKPVRKPSVKKNYVYNLAYQMLAVVIPLLIQPYIARVLGAGEVGAFSYTTAITGYFALVGNLGIATYGQLRIAAYRNDRKIVSQVFWELAVLRFILMLASAGIFLLFIRFVARPEYKTLYTVLLVQIAGLVARRIVCRLRKGDSLERAQRFGMIKFGSKVDVYLPLTAKVTVKLGDQVYAGQTVIAEPNG